MEGEMPVAAPSLEKTPTGAERLAELLSNFQKTCTLGSNRKGLWTYKDTFVGLKAVDALVEAKIAEDRETAVKMGERLMELGGFGNITGSGRFRDDSNLYRFAKDDDGLKQYNTHHVRDGFYNVRGSFKTAYGLVELGNQMSLIQLESGRFLIIDCVDMTPNLKTQIDEITHAGELIEAVLCTHPFHTLHIPPFRQLYPDVPFYGCPRHLERMPESFVGSFEDQKVLEMWEPEVSLRIPDGLEFLKPIHPDHASCVFVYHHASQTLHVDDTFIYHAEPSFLMKSALFKRSNLVLHPQVPNSADTQAKLNAFRLWLSQIAVDWPVANIACAHLMVLYGGGQQAIKSLADDDQIWDKLKAGKPAGEDPLSASLDRELGQQVETSIFTESGELNTNCECG